MRRCGWAARCCGTGFFENPGTIRGTLSIFMVEGPASRNGRPPDPFDILLLLGMTWAPGWVPSPSGRGRGADPSSVAAPGQEPDVRPPLHRGAGRRAPD